jgi:hypothetical protein
MVKYKRRQKNMLAEKGGSAIAGVLLTVNPESKPWPQM